LEASFRSGRRAQAGLAPVLRACLESEGFDRLGVLLEAWAAPRGTASALMELKIVGSNRIVIEF
jgi:hypothetical protein